MNETHAVFRRAFSSSLINVHDTAGRARFNGRFRSTAPRPACHICISSPLTQEGISAHLPSFLASYIFSLFTKTKKQISQVDAKSTDRQPRLSVYYTCTLVDYEKCRTKMQRTKLFKHQPKRRRSKSRRKRFQKNVCTLGETCFF